MKRSPTIAGLRRVAVAVALALVLSACSAGSTPAAPADSAPGTAGASGLLEFAAGTVDGGRFDASALAGTPVVLWFWAPF
jgi:cytochrome oxidase Cu insertion factor (SCO1/SenC/PrrC family)